MTVTERNMSAEARMSNTSEAVTPKLIEAPLREAPTDDGPKVGDAAPGDVPSVSMKDLHKIIKEQVEEQVAERIRAIEEDEPEKMRITGEDQQFSNFEKKLEVYGVDLLKVIPGFKTHWFNDDGDRIMRMLARGYTFVTRTEVALNDNKLTPLNQDTGDNIAIYVGRRADGAPMRAFLMKIPQDKYEAQYNRQQEHNDLIERSIQRGEIGNAMSQGGYAGTDGPSGVKLKYNPRSGQSLMRRPDNS